MVLVAREIYILNKLTLMPNNTFTIQLLDLFVNSEADEDPEKLNTVYMVTNYEKTDMSSLMQS